MCAVCIELAKGTITVKEAGAALSEIIHTDKNVSENYPHYQEVSNELSKRILEEVYIDQRIKI